ncbi:Protein transport protein SEC13 [Dictyocoela roeselum]|nr:Protein transport protein SEC13 [Dictyocoela roeselum]
MSPNENILFNIHTSPDHQKMLKSTSNGIEIFKIIGNEMVLDTTLKKHTDPVVNAFFLDNDIISVDFGGMLLLWKLTNSGYTPVFEKSIGAAVNTMCLDSTSKTVYAGMADGKIKKVYLEGDHPIEEVFAHSCGVSAIGCNSSRIVSGGMDNMVVVWSHDLKKLAVKSDHTDFIRAVAVSNNDFDFFVFASCGEDKRIFVYDGEKQVIEVDDIPYSLDWSDSGYCLGVAYGDSKYKAFIPDENGKFREVEMSKVE